MGEEAEDAQAVVHGDDDDAAMREELAILAILGGASGVEAATVDPDHNGEAGRFLLGLGVEGRPDVEGEAVFRWARIVEDHVGIAAGLDAVRAEVAGEEDFLPLADRHRRAPAKFVDGRLRVGNAFVGDDFLVGSEDSKKLAGLDLDGADFGWFLSLDNGCGGEDGGEGDRDCELGTGLMH